MHLLQEEAAHVLGAHVQVLGAVKLDDAFRAHKLHLGGPVGHPERADCGLVSEVLDFLIFR